MTTPVPAVAPPRRGTPKIVPVVVSAGLAVGVFCGLLFGLGTGKAADARPGSSDDALALAIRNAVEDARTERTAPPPPPPPPPIVIDAAPAAVGSAGSGSAGSGSGTGSGSAPLDATRLGEGSGAGSAAPPVLAPPPEKPTPAITKATLTFRATPATAAISVDKQAVSGGSLVVDLTGGKRKVRVEASASGYRSYDKTFDVTGDQAIEIRMTKRVKKPGGGGGLMEPD